MDLAVAFPIGVVDPKHVFGGAQCTPEEPWMPVRTKQAKLTPVHFNVGRTGRRALDVPYEKKPNQAPEPTPGSVTSRAD